MESRIQVKSWCSKSPQWALMSWVHYILCEYRFKSLGFRFKSFFCHSGRAFIGVSEPNDQIKLILAFSTG
ncbi:MAG: hypothetical protein P8X79_05660 [Reinekea sp.]